MKAMILAAGRGKRMGTLTEELPKPLLSVGEESLIERHVRCLAEAGIDEIVINLSHLGQRIRSRLGDGQRWNLHISYSDEGATPLETAGGIVQALALLGSEPFLLINADTFTDFDFARLKIIDGQGTLVMVSNPPHNPSGDFGIDAESRLTDAAPKLTFAGISLLAADLFAHLQPGPRALKPIFDASIARGGLHGLRYDGLWMDIGTPERLYQAQALVGHAT